MFSYAKYLLCLLLLSMKKVLVGNDFMSTKVEF